MMQIRFLTIILVLFVPFLLLADVNFDDYFIDKTMRIDYFHIGDASNELITIDHIYQQGSWAGSTSKLVDRFNNGRYYIKVFDSVSGELLYSRGFDSYFGEYKTSTPAINGEQKTYHETALIPYPKNKIHFSIERRNKQNVLEPFFSRQIDPSDIGILRDKLDAGVKVYKQVNHGDPHKKVDLVFVGEGYSKSQQKKFESDLEKFTDIFFSQEPYKSQKEKFNIYGVYKPSRDAGVDEPHHNSYKNTVVNATFNSMGSPRYLLTEDNKALRDIAAHAPYDALLIMVNHSRYGGGGIYNFYCTFTTDNQWHKYLLLHEFGHSFGGLGDEYYSSATAYNDFYPPGIEPTEPNVTALLDPDNVKWKHLVAKGTAIPTPWGKEKYDEMAEEYGKKRTAANEKIAKLKREHASAGQIKSAEQESADLSRNRAKQSEDFIKNNKYFGKVGAFEGAGYSSEGLYRPMLDCIMFSVGQKPYCKVCDNAVEKVIQHLSE